MTAEALIVKAGIATTVQDLGRVGYRACGVPHSGALDPLSLKLVNRVVGNPAGTGVLEMLYSGIVLEARGGAIRVALGGSEATIETSSGVTLRNVPRWQSTLVHAGERLRVGPIVDAAAAYLAFEGGFAIAPVLGSLSTYLRGELGGWRGRALRSGDVLPLARDALERTEQRLAEAPSVAMPRTLRVQAGPHLERFGRNALATFLERDYMVTPASDRSGLRLEGARLDHAQGYDLPSEGVVPGSIQVPGSGQPVLLVADHPTVGGYPRIATIISADLAAAGRLRIGASVRFSRVDAEEAARARDEAHAAYTRIADSLRSGRSHDTEVYPDFPP
ncbi:MAG TPA: biotin-dependent carboxyltransferase family protein [Burkholderiales bacterium]|nr:biotin-dependent carboxyltransferase family protein [Burkholderiales bacterium]